MLFNEGVVARLLSVLDEQQTEQFLDANANPSPPLKALLLSNPRNLLNFSTVTSLERMRF